MNNLKSKGAELKNITKVMREVEEIVSVMCDVCKKIVNVQNETIDSIIGVEEMTSISYCGGYGSVFGDQSKIELDICQECLQERLGDFIRVTPGNNW